MKRCEKEEIKLTWGVLSKCSALSVVCFKNQYWLIIGIRSRLSVRPVLFWLFQEDVDSFMKQPGNETADAVLRRLDEQYQKYKYMELNLSQKKLR